MRSRMFVAVVLAVCGVTTGLHAQSQTLKQGELANIKALKCTFPTSVIAAWNNEGAPEPKVRPMGTLTLDITEIEAADGSAIVGGKDVNVQVYGWNIHFLEAGASGRMAITTVFAQTSIGNKLKAVHSRTDYLPIDLPGFKSQPEVAQFYGDCEIK